MSWNVILYVIVVRNYFYVANKGSKLNKVVNKNAEQYLECVHRKYLLNCISLVVIGWFDLWCFEDPFVAKVWSVHFLLF